MPELELHRKLRHRCFGGLEAAIRKRKQAAYGDEAGDEDIVIADYYQPENHITVVTEENASLLASEREVEIELYEKKERDKKINLEQAKKIIKGFAWPLVFTEAEYLEYLQSIPEDLIGQKIRKDKKFHAKINYLSPTGCIAESVYYKDKDLYLSKCREASRDGKDVEHELITEQQYKDECDLDVDHLILDAPIVRTEEPPDSNETEYDLRM